MGPSIIRKKRNQLQNFGGDSDLGFTMMERSKVVVAAARTCELQTGDLLQYQEIVLP